MITYLNKNANDAEHKKHKNFNIQISDYSNEMMMMQIMYELSKSDPALFNLPVFPDFLLEVQFSATGYYQRLSVVHQNQQVVVIQENTSSVIHCFDGR